MPLENETEIQSTIKTLVATDSTFTNRSYDDLLDINQTTDDVHSYRTVFNGQQTDTAIDFGRIVGPTYILLIFNSQATGAGANPDGTHESVTVKIDGSTGADSDTVLLYTSDAINDTLPTAITFSSVSDSNTEVTVVIGGRTA